MRAFERSIWVVCVLVLAAVVCRLAPMTQMRAVDAGDGIARRIGIVRGETAAESAPVPAVTSASGTFEPQKQNEESREIRLSNKTDYAVDLTQLDAPVFSPGTGKKRVLIVHTHGSEAYTPDAEYPYMPTDTDRTDDCSRNVVAAGRALAAILNARGITTLHDETLHDDPSYSGSYSRSLDTVERYLKEYPEIELVIDLHRDAFIYEDGTRLRCVCEVDGEKAAQIMLVVGTDAGGLSHPAWMDNLGVAAALQKALESLNPGITRPIDLREQRFNQHVSKGALIVELGASGNTLGEALRSVPVLADAVANLLGEA